MKKVYEFKPTGCDQEGDALEALIPSPEPENIATLYRAYHDAYPTWGLGRCRMAAIFQHLDERYGQRLQGTDHASRYAEVIEFGRRKLAKARATAAKAEIQDELL